jgi:hypothetical protein
MLLEVVPFAAAKMRNFCQTEAGRRIVWLRIGSPSLVGCARVLPRLSDISSSAGQQQGRIGEDVTMRSRIRKRCMSHKRFNATNIHRAL